LQEIGDLTNVTPVKINKRNNFNYDFIVLEKIKCRVRFENFIQDQEDIDLVKHLNDSGHWAKLAWEDKKVFNIRFSINGKFIQGAEVEFSVFNVIIKTIIEVVKLFIENQKPDVLIIASIGRPKKGEKLNKNTKINYFNAAIANNITHLDNWAYAKSQFNTVLYNLETIK
jgi:hypothetical protein